MRLVKDAHNDARLSYLGVEAAPPILSAMDLTDRQHWIVTGQEAEFTSVVDGTHSKHSRHYVGMAFDLRIWYLTNQDDFVVWLQAHLGDSYDVVLESTHIHVEFDPER
jgi:hypothetical protein